MKISVITTVKNDLKGFMQTAESVLSQEYKEIEYIVVDASSEQTIRKDCIEYIPKIDILIEGEDNSPYDGMNRGIKAATGDIIALLHAGDIYCDTSILSEIAEKFIETGCSFLYGDIVYHSKKDAAKIVRKWKSREIKKEDAQNGIFPPHTSLFIKKDVCLMIGEYDTKYEIAADSDFMFRLFSQNTKSIYLDRNILSMRIGGRSNGSILSIIKSNIEFTKILKKHKVGNPVFKSVRKIISKIKQLGI
jgi:glycosyltransferase involved in cell wall biosynthesis